MKRLLAIGFVFLAATAQAHADAAHGAKATGGSQPHAAALGRPGQAREVTRTVDVTLSDAMRFSPSVITVKRGETIRFRVTNHGSLKHEFVLGRLAELREHAALMARFPGMEHDDPNAVTVEPGKTAELVWHFTRAGRFHFACLVPGHFEAGMRGRIIVTAE